MRGVLEFVINSMSKIALLGDNNWQICLVSPNIVYIYSLESSPRDNLRGYHIIFIGIFIFSGLQEAIVKGQWLYGFV